MTTGSAGSQSKKSVEKTPNTDLNTFLTLFRESPKKDKKDKSGRTNPDQEPPPKRPKTEIEVSNLA